MVTPQTGEKTLATRSRRLAPDQLGMGVTPAAARGSADISEKVNLGSGGLYVGRRCPVPPEPQGGQLLSKGKGRPSTPMPRRVDQDLLLALNCQSMRGRGGPLRPARTRTVKEGVEVSDRPGAPGISGLYGGELLENLVQLTLTAWAEGAVPPRLPRISSFSTRINSRIEGTLCPSGCDNGAPAPQRIHPQGWAR